MSSLVLKEWKASSTPLDAENNYVRIVGREAGLWAWFLATIKVDPTTSILINPNRVQFTAGSFSGSSHRMISLKNISSTYYGYHKPWQKALVLFVILAAIATPALVVPILNAVFIILAVGIPLLYYFFNRTLTLGFVENSGVISGIQFKRSLIEGQDIDEAQAKYICDLTQHLIDSKK